MEQDQEATSDKCTNELSNSQDVSNASLDMSSGSGKDSFNSQHAANSNSEDFSTGITDSDMASKLFPEFLLLDVHRGDRSLFKRTREKMKFNDLAKFDKSGRKQNYSKSCEDIVRWIRTEYRI